MNLRLSGQVFPDDLAALYREEGYDRGFFSPSDVRDAVAALPAGEELVLEINSVGGSVDGGNEIYSILQGCKNPTRAVVQSMAASAASYMIMACDRIEMQRPAQMMIHRVGCGVLMYGNRDDFDELVRMLDKKDASILGTYKARTKDKATKPQLFDLMQKETYLTAEECVNMGLADGIVERERNGVPSAVAASVHNNLITAMNTLPTEEELKAMRTKRMERDSLLEAVENAKSKYQTLKEE